MDTPLPNRKGVLLETYGNAEFSRDAVARFPELQEELEEYAELLHVQMGTLKRAVRSAVSAGDIELALQICAFLNEALSQPRAISEIEVAVAISFVEAYELREGQVGKAVLKRMPKRVRQIILDQEARGGAQ